MSDTRLINKIAGYLSPEALDDCETFEDQKKIAKEIIKIVRKHDKDFRGRVFKRVEEVDKRLKIIEKDIQKGIEIIKLFK